MAHPIRALPAILLVAIAAGCATSASPGSDASPGASSGASLFAPPSWPAEPVAALELAAYDASTQLDLREEAPARDEGGVAVHDVSWLSPGGGRVTAWLVVPPGEGPFAGLVYLHGSETWRDDFLDEAIAMARGGAVSLVIDAPFARMGDNRHYALAAFEDAEEERAMTAQTVVDLRRAYDVLAARDDVDAGRLGFVGHSWGASLGAVLAAVDPRPSSLVLITGRPSWTGFLETSDEAWVARARERSPAAEWDVYITLMAPLDAMAVIDEVAAERLYLQYGTADTVVPTDVSQELIDAAPGAAVDLYDAGHALDDEATADRVAWLVERLDLEPISDEVIAGVGLPDR